MTGLEKAARAVDDATSGELTESRCLTIARAVLLAIREPDDEMRRSGWKVLREKNDFQFRRGNSLAGVEAPVFTAMIDAILDGK